MKFLIFFFLAALATLFSQESSTMAEIELRHIEGGGIGYSHGYTTLAVLGIPYKRNNDTWPFFDLRGHVFNNGGFAGNAGIACRIDFDKVVSGFNIFYDFRRTHSHLFFNQIGAGVELLFERFDFRINGYLPFPDHRKTSDCVIFIFPNQRTISLSKYKVALRGFDLELGATLWKNAWSEIYAAAGPYAYGGDVCRTAAGGKGRLKVNLSDYFFLEGRVSHDSIFHTRVQGLIGVQFRLGDTSEPNFVSRGVSEPIQRNEIIVLDNNCRWKTN